MGEILFSKPFWFILTFGKRLHSKTSKILTLNRLIKETTVKFHIDF